MLLINQIMGLKVEQWTYEYLTQILIYCFQKTIVPPEILWSYWKSIPKVITYKHGIMRTT